MRVERGHVYLAIKEPHRPPSEWTSYFGWVLPLGAATSTCMPWLLRVPSRTGPLGCLLATAVACIAAVPCLVHCHIWPCAYIQAAQ